MNNPVQVTCRNFALTESISSAVNGEVDDLERIFDRITSCHVVIEQPHHHKRQGNHFRVLIDLSVPGQELVVGRDPTDRRSHEDPFVAISESFRAVKRMLQSYVDKRVEEPRRLVQRSGTEG